jgi:hypothetical protein
MIQRCLLLLVLLLPAPLLAQEDVPTVTEIVFDRLIEADIRGGAFFDWWQIQAQAGDTLVVTMQADDTLAPRLAILDPGGDAVALSEEGAPGAALTLEYVVTTPGLYTVVATRAGGPDGTTEGRYLLQVRNATARPTQPNPYQNVVFVCQDFEAVTAVTLRIMEDLPADGSDLRHRITVYGLGGFKPVIRTTSERLVNLDDCNADAKYTGEDTFTLPGEETRAMSPDRLDEASQVILNGAQNLGIITLAIGSRQGAPGRYMAIIEGFTLDAGDLDGFEVAIGPRAARSTALLVYMVAMPDSRLDPLITRLDTEESCDDAGRGGCVDVPSFAGAGAVLHERERLVFTGDRNDAGLKLMPGAPDFIPIELSSRGGRTRGAYALVLIGELPPLD